MADSPDQSTQASPSLTPMQQLAAHIEQRRAAQHANGADSVPGSPSSRHETPSSSSNPSDLIANLTSTSSSPTTENDNHMLSSGAMSTGNAQSTNLALLAPCLKRARKLGQHAGTDLDIFLGASPMEREGHQYALALACHDKLSSIVAQLDYKVPSTLSDTAKDYANAFMLSATITSYRYTKTPSLVLQAMRELNITDVPLKRETGRCTQVEKIIRSTITTCRYAVKDKIMSTFHPDPEDTIDIASLTAAIVSSTKVKPTAALYMRIAFIRWVAQEWPETREDDNFWLKVDEQLREQVAEFETPTKIQEACRAIYEADKLRYGQPDLLSHPMIEAHLQDDWITALGDKSATLPLRKQGKKRARADADDI